MALTMTMSLSAPWANGGDGGVGGIRFSKVVLSSKTPSETYRSLCEPISGILPYETQIANAPRGQPEASNTILVITGEDDIEGA